MSIFILLILAFVSFTCGYVKKKENDKYKLLSFRIYFVDACMILQKIEFVFIFEKVSSGV